MRLFIAINFPLKVKDEIGKTIGKSVTDFPQVVWTRKENIHLTVKFLGNIDGKLKAQNSNVKTNGENGLLEKIKLGIEEAVVGIKPFELIFDKLGFFEREQLIIWLGAKSDPQLSLLIEKVDKEMEKLGFVREKRAFTAHIAIGRGKHLNQNVLQSLKQVINTKQFILPKSFSVSEIYLMNSTLIPKGSIYTKLFKFALS